MDKDCEDKLEQLLAEEETIGETKQSNIKLLEFLKQKENLEALLTYALSEPPEDGSQNRKYKFPFVAADVLSCSPAIAEALINKRPKFKEEEEDQRLELSPP
mmetsp:Transcript_39799/g.38350  ORF Transcript_39799/g.38350 Transcript_39799/m.38350 type:complete len:102 (+) Transcript_39799:87-392(+)